MNAIEYFGRDSGSYCGYCGSDDGFISHGLWLFSVTPCDYEKLLDKGWRRSGNYLYKPENEETCCPQYPIRCLTISYQPSKSKRKIFQKIRKVFTKKESIEIKFDGPKGDTGDLLTYRNVRKQRSLSVTSKNKTCQFPLPKYKSMNSLTALSTRFSACDLIDLHTKRKPNLKFKQYISREGTKIEELMNESQRKSLSNTKEYKSKRGLRLEKNKVKSLDELVISSKIKVTLESVTSISGDITKIMEEYRIYYLYQGVVHCEKIDNLSVESFCDFLIESPIQNDDFGYGSFHMQYRYLDELVAVGVIDILPHCISSVYFFYNPKYGKCSLGIFSILCEINLTQQLSRIKPDLKYHYSGYFIHNCRKMNYKSQFKPTFICCPITGTWVPFHHWTSDRDEIRPSMPKFVESLNEPIGIQGSDSKILEFLLGSDVYNNSNITF